jgi:hypothetical protein
MLPPVGVPPAVAVPLPPEDVPAVLVLPAVPGPPIPTPEGASLPHPATTGSRQTPKIHEMRCKEVSGMEHRFMSAIAPWRRLLRGAFDYLQKASRAAPR